MEEKIKELKKRKKKSHQFSSNKQRRENKLDKTYTHKKKKKKKFICPPGLLYKCDIWIYYVYSLFNFKPFMEKSSKQFS